MAEEFKTITTQEEFDTAIKSRLAREESKIRAEYSDYQDLKTAKEAYESEKKKYEADMQAKINDLTNQLTKANEELKKSHLQGLKTKIAFEAGLPAGIVNRLTGETEEELRKDAVTLSEIFKAENRKDLPRYNNEHTITPEEVKDQAYRSLVKNLNNKE